MFEATVIATQRGYFMGLLSMGGFVRRYRVALAQAHDSHVRHWLGLVDTYRTLCIAQGL